MLKIPPSLQKELEVAYHRFVSMALTKQVIHAATISQNRIRRFNGTDVFECQQEPAPQ